MIPQLSIDALPAWAHLNDVEFTNATLQHVQGKGFGLVAKTDWTNGDDQGVDKPPTLLRIPRDLVLSAQAVEEYAKVDGDFRQLLDAAGHQSTRQDILLYLLTHLILPTRDQGSSRRGVSTPWTEYIKFLPRSIPVPTMWDQAERTLLQGTSLETALGAKLAALAAEFDDVREKTSGLLFWNSLFWEKDSATLEHWVLVDAWYRSRCLELPRTGNAMVPGLDMVNHSRQPMAYYEEDNNDDVVLLLRPSGGVSCGDEIAISYGEAKSAAEMLFSYGFVDKESPGQGLSLPVETLPDDPLAKAKLHIFKAPASLKLSRTGGMVEWESPFAYLLCLNEEDGLEFRVLQDTAGERQLRLFWQEEDVTERADTFETLIEDHPLCQVFKLRVVAVLQELVSTQLAHLRSGISHDQLEPLLAAGLLRADCVESAETLREAEASLLEEAAKVLESKKTHLLADDHVVAYLGSMEDAQSEQVSGMSANEEEDFS